MDVLTKQDFKLLTKLRKSPAVSIYMPSHPSAAETLQDQIRYKNLLKEAEKEIEIRAEEFQDSRGALDTAAALLEDGLFWRRQSRGLALFVSRDFYRSYRLSKACEERVMVANRFLIRPLLPLLDENTQFYVLALSQNHVRLLSCTRHRHRTVQVEGMPKSIAEVLRYDQVERQLEFHTGTPGGMGKRTGMFHGQGVGKDDANSNIERYVRAVAASIEKKLAEQKISLVLVADESLFPVYVGFNGYTGLLGNGVRGNPDEMSGKELREAAWPEVASHLRTIREGVVRRYREFADRNRTVGNVCEAVIAAFHGRVELLFLATGRMEWGRFDTEKGLCRLHRDRKTGDEDLLDLAAFFTMGKGGRVYAFPQEGIPEKGSIAALLRY